MRYKIVALALAGLLVLPAVAEAKRLTRGNSSWKSISRIGKGVVELGLDQLFLLRSDSTESQSATQVIYLGGPTLRVFVIDNLSLALNINLTYRHEASRLNNVEASSGQLGASGMLGLNYYLHIAGGFFFKPGFGMGGFYSKRRLPATTISGLEIVHTVAGFTGRVDIGFAFFFSRRVNVKAGIDVLASFGKDTPDSGTVDGQSFSRVDGGFNVGIAYVF